MDGTLASISDSGRRVNFMVPDKRQYTALNTRLLGHPTTTTDPALPEPYPNVDNGHPQTSDTSQCKE